jgi:hypothetical protein
LPLRFFDDAGYNLGMIRDTASWLLPKGAVYDASNLIGDVPGVLRQRGGTTALVSGSQTAFCTSIGVCYSADGTPIEEIYGVNGKTGDIYSINKTTGASTNINAGSSPCIVGRPVRHFGFVVFPFADFSTDTLRQMVYASGATAAGTFGNAVVAQVTAGDSQVTLTGADVTTNIKVGHGVTINDGTHRYYGRVVSIDTTKKFTVWPTPTFTNAAVPIAGVQTFEAGGSFGGACAASFQNRLLFGNTNDYSSVGLRLLTDRRIYYSPLPTETVNITGITAAGALFLEPGQWPALNYIESPAADPIVAMEPVSDNQLLILTSTHPVIFSGNLTTQLSTTSPTITFDISEVPGNASCISDLGVQRSPRGPIWAGYGGIYAWDGRKPDNLTDKRVNSYWRSLVRGASFALHGSAYVRDHYIVTGTSAGSTFALACNLSNLTWTRMSNVDVFLGVAKPTDPSVVFAARWWDQLGAAPSMTNGQTIRLESMFDPFVPGSTRTDADGSSVSFSVTSRPLTGDSETQKLWQRGTVRYASSQTAANITVTAQSKIDASDIQAGSVRTLGSLSSTHTSTITNATNANPIVVTTSAAHGLQDEDFVNIDAVGGNTNANGRQRIKLINSTSFSIIGGIGNAAYTSGGQVQKLTETDFLMSPLNAGQGASVTIASTGAVNDFQFQGLRLAALEKGQVMSA